MIIQKKKEIKKRIRDRGGNRENRSYVKQIGEKRTNALQSAEFYSKLKDNSKVGFHGDFNLSKGLAATCTLQLFGQRKSDVFEFYFEFGFVTNLLEKNRPGRPLCSVSKGVLCDPSELDSY